MIFLVGFKQIILSAIAQIQIFQYKNLKTSLGYSATIFLYWKSYSLPFKGDHTT